MNEGKQISPTNCLRSRARSRQRNQKFHSAFLGRVENWPQAATTSSQKVNGYGGGHECVQINGTICYFLHGVGGVKQQCMCDLRGTINTIGPSSTTQKPIEDLKQKKSISFHYSTRLKPSSPPLVAFPLLATPYQEGQDES
jgi:hypothetical protein